jgi:hypothetical protein
MALACRPLVFAISLNSSLGYKQELGSLPNHVETDCSGRTPQLPSRRYLAFFITSLWLHKYFKRSEY